MILSLIKIVPVCSASDPTEGGGSYPEDDDIGPDGGYDMDEDVSERALGHSKL